MNIKFTLHMNSIPVSMINEVMNVRKSSDEPSVGMLGTYYVGSDRYAVVVTAVETPRKIHILTLYDFDDSDRIVTEDGIEYYAHDIDELIAKNAPKYHPEFGDNAMEIYESEVRRMNDTTTYTLRKNGRWLRKGDWLWDCGAVHLGKADPYLDPSF